MLNKNPDLVAPYSKNGDAYTCTFGEEDRDRMIVIRKKEPQTAQRGEEVQQFCDIIIHTVNNNEKWAVLHHFDLPELYPGEPFSDSS